MENENSAWEHEEGIPQFEDPFIQQYLKGRDALIAEEHKRRHGKEMSMELKAYCTEPCLVNLLSSSDDVVALIFAF